ncbi:MAG: hypothetical protein AAFV69_05365 [Pseudomonadota bacterium]
MSLRLAKTFCTACFVMTVMPALGVAETPPVATASEGKVSPCAEASKMAPDALYKVLTDERKLPEVHKDASYIALQDKATFAMWTFTQESQAAHPAVVCRVPLKEGDTITLDMVVNCAGPEKACSQLEFDFKELNRRMQLEVEKQTR